MVFLGNGNEYVGIKSSFLGVVFRLGRQAGRQVTRSNTAHDCSSWRVLYNSNECFSGDDV